MFNSDLDYRRLTVETLDARLMLSSSGWDGPGMGSASLTYYVEPVPVALGISEKATLGALEAAFEVWTDVADIEITKTTRPRLRDSIDISFEQIDGEGGILAEAYLPDDVTRFRLAGDITFDIGDDWEVGGNDRFKTDFMWVAVHEIGHALGLEHSDNTNSVMHESVGPFRSFRGLHESDVDSILLLYAARPLPVPGDLTGDDLVDVSDIDVLNAQISSAQPDDSFDLNEDGLVDSVDRDVLIIDVLDTAYGDADLDGSFDSSDLIDVFQAAAFEDSTKIASWRTGDWNGDRLFDTSDLILAFQSGAYRQ